MKEGGNRKEQWEQQRTRTEESCLMISVKDKRGRRWADLEVDGSCKAGILQTIFDSSIYGNYNVRVY